MAWETITSDDVDHVLSSSEKTTVGTAYAGTMTVADVISLVVSRVRGYVGKVADLEDSEAETIPPNLRLTALVLIRHHLLSRIPGSETLLTDVRLTEYQDATRELERVAKGLIDIERPAACVPDKVEVASGVAYSSGAAAFGGDSLMEF